MNKGICKDKFIYLKQKVKYHTPIKCSLYPISLVSIPVCEWQPQCGHKDKIDMAKISLSTSLCFHLPHFPPFLQRFSIIFSCEKLNLKYFVIFSVTRLTRPSWRNKLRQVWVFGAEWSWTVDRFSVYLIVCVEGVEVAVTMLHTKQSEGRNLGHGLHKWNFTSLALCAVYILQTTSKNVWVYFFNVSKKKTLEVMCNAKQFDLKISIKTTLECELQMLWNAICILFI